MDQNFTQTTMTPVAATLPISAATNSQVAGYQVSAPQVVPFPAPSAQYSQGFPQAYPMQGTAAMAPQMSMPVPQPSYNNGYPSNVIPFPAQHQGMQQGYTPMQAQSQAQPTQDGAWQTVREAMQLLASRNGQAPSLPPAVVPLMPQFQGYQQPYPQQPQVYQQGYQQGYPQTSPQALPYGGSTYSQTYGQPQQQNPLLAPSLPQYQGQQYQGQQYQGQQYQGQQGQQANGGFATSQELTQYFGSAEVAADSLNKYACMAEDQLEQASVQLQQLAAYTQQLQQKHEALVDINTDPGKLAQWYLQLEQIYGELPGFTPQDMQQAQYQTVNMQGYPTQGGQVSQMNPGLASATLANQMYNQMNSQVAPQSRPQFPQMPVGNPAGQQAPNLTAVPANQRYMMLDQLQATGGLKGARLVF